MAGMMVESNVCQGREVYGRRVGWGDDGYDRHMKIINIISVRIYK